MSFRSNYALVPLGDVAKFINGDRSTNYPKGDDYVDDGPPFISAADLSEGRVSFSSARRISIGAYERLRSGKIQERDVLFCLRGSIGKIAYVRDPEVGAIASSLVIVRATEVVDSQYLFFSLRSQSGQQAALDLNNGAAQPNLSVGELQKIRLPFPPFSTQRRIASILSTYDDLIDNNARRIAILEEMARRIYEEWFVRFRFQGHEHVKMFESELGLVPEGWRLASISAFGDVVTGKTPSKANPAFFGYEVPFLKIPDMHGNMFALGTAEALSAEGAASQQNKTIPAGAICVSCIGTIGVVSIATQPCQTNQQINSIVLKDEVSLEFLYFRLRDAKKALENLGANGATMGNVNKGKFENLSILEPPLRLLATYHECVRPMFRTIETLARKNANLRATRDLLLPKLISGELDVSAMPDPRATAA